MPAMKEHDPSNKSSVAAFANLANNYEKGTGGAHHEAAQKLMLLSPPFTESSHILDNATGTGIVLEEIQKHIARTSPGSFLRVPVVAADAAQSMIEYLNAKIEHMKTIDGWPNLDPIRTHLVAAEKLDSAIVPGESITHAYMSFGLFFCSDPVSAASNIHRCLVPGGTALITTWRNLSFMVPIHQAFRGLYPEEPDFKMPFSNAWEDAEYIKDVLAVAGFTRERIQVTQDDVYTRFADVHEMAQNKTELFTKLVMGPRGWKSKEAKDEFIAQLAEILLSSEGFIDEKQDGVSLRMTMNVAVCTK